MTLAIDRASVENAPPVLDVHGLVKRYRPTTGLPEGLLANAGLDLRVRRGEIVALLGPNGAGKTTFLQQVAGQLLPTSGSITVAGVDLVTDPIRAKEFLSVIPQECEPLESLTVVDHVRFFGLLKGMARASAEARTAVILKDTGLAEHGQKRIRDLSGGLRRRVLVAVALAGAAPQLMLLDEPTTGLDPEARRTVWHLIDGLRRKGLGILLTTHYIDEAEYLADRVVIIDHGRFAAQGTVEEILGHIGFRGRLEIRDLHRHDGQVKRQVEALRSRWRPILETENLLRLAVPDPFGQDVLSAAAALTGLGVRASVAPVSLEDAYLAIVGSLDP